MSEVSSILTLDRNLDLKSEMYEIYGVQDHRERRRVG